MKRRVKLVARRRYDFTDEDRHDIADALDDTIAQLHETGANVKRLVRRLTKLRIWIARFDEHPDRSR